MRAMERSAETHPEKEAGAVTRWPDWEERLLEANWFDFIPSSLIRHFPRVTDRGLFGDPNRTTWAPVVEVKEEPGRFRLMVELPGIRPEDVKVHAVEDAIVLEGERKTEREEKRNGFYHSERTYGRFYRSIPLPKHSEP